MNKDLEDKIKNIYIQCKSLLTKHEFSDVLSNEEFSTKEVWDEFARQINYTNQFLAREKDLYFILTLLAEAKGNLTDGTPSSNKMLKKIDFYSEQINLLLKGYSQVIIGQRWILDYYIKGGGLM